PDGGGYFTQTLWLRAIPENWAWSEGFEGWYLEDGGYYTQTFWLHAVPEDWGPRAGSLGDEANQGYYRWWFWRGAVAKNWVKRDWKLGSRERLGYYRFFFWGHAVPGAWAPQAAFGGWRDATGGYYEQSLWQHAVPQNWTSYDEEVTALGQAYYRVDGDDIGHYRHFLWEYAIPENWADRPDFVEGWPWPEGGYYTQTFWWRAVPEDWSPGAEYAIGGRTNRGHYAFWLYHFAAPRGFAWRPGWSVRGSDGASYYLFHMHETLSGVHPDYAEMRRLTSGHLEGARVPRPVDTWFDAEAEAVVVLSFDTEGAKDQSCRVHDLLVELGVDASFMLDGVGSAGAETDPEWMACVREHDVGNHTKHHSGAVGYSGHSWSAGNALLNTTDSATQRREIEHQQTDLQRIFGRTAASFRAPFCDGHRSFDGSVVETLEWVRSRPSGSGGRHGLHVDSSIASVSRYGRARGITPPSHLSDLSVQSFPYPYSISGGEDTLIEIPFAYPSDWTGYNGDIVDRRLGRSVAGDEDRYLSTIWKRTLDEIHEQRGVMVLVLHPWIIGYSDANLDGLREFVEYARRDLDGVRFSTLEEVGRRFAEHAP
ncbi:MAG: polysaccharide deacetylase family protein, partial [Myxococcota bacterium]